MGCEVTSNMSSLVVLNLPGKLAGKEKDLVAGCRAHGFGIWPTLSEPVQVRIGILNQLTPEAITEIVNRFADAMLDMGAEFDKQLVMNGLKPFGEARGTGPLFARSCAASMEMIIARPNRSCRSPKCSRPVQWPRA
jgi:hypothetical protein